MRCIPIRRCGHRMSSITVVSGTASEGQRRVAVTHQSPRVSLLLSYHLSRLQRLDRMRGCGWSKHVVDCLVSATCELLRRATLSHGQGLGRGEAICRRLMLACSDACCTTKNLLHAGIAHTALDFRCGHHSPTRRVGVRQYRHSARRRRASLCKHSVKTSTSSTHTWYSSTTKRYACARRPRARILHGQRRS